MPSPKPNILLITCHDLGRHLGCYGKDVQTPAINRLASESVRFDRYFCTAPQCSPSRVSITTGRYPHSAGVLGLVNGGKSNWNLPDEVPTLAKTFRGAGWSTHLWGIQHENQDPSRLGYERNHLKDKDYQNRVFAPAITPPLCEWLESSPQAPFFCRRPV